jgi:hypothetical protein
MMLAGEHQGVSFEARLRIGAAGNRIGKNILERPNTHE